MVADLLGWEMLIAAFAGGAFGASIGALQSFSLAGLMIIVGELYELIARTMGVEPAVDITGTIGFGVVLGPHVAFGGGAAAAAYAAKRGYFDTEFAYHEAKNVTQGLGNRPDVLFVGGIFGVFGFVVAELSIAMRLPLDGIALGIVLSAFAHRLLFGYSIIGEITTHALDMSPYERGERRRGTENRFVVEPWLPFLYRWSHVIFLGVIVGILAGYITFLTGSTFLAFGISAFALALMCAGVPNIPVTHHITLPASTIVVASAGVSTPFIPVGMAASIPLGEALLLGAIFGLLGALFGELSQRIFYAHAETHFDPPGASIVVTSLIIGILALLGVIPASAWIPLPG